MGVAMPCDSTINAPYAFYFLKAQKRTEQNKYWIFALSGKKDIYTCLIWQ
jgi:hypothetical protein